MTKIFKALFISMLLSIPLQMNAQDEILDFLFAAPADAEKLTEFYIEPVIKGFGYGLNHGWYNTAGTHKPLGFNISFTAAIAFVPSSDENFTFKNSDYTTVRLENSSLSQASSPTVFGDDTNGPTVEIIDPSSQQVLGTGPLPPGTGFEDEVGFSAVPMLVPQVDIGIIKNTDLMIRFLPEINIGDDGKFQYWGVGVKHDIKQWIPGMKMLPFHLSIMLGYTNIDATVDFSESISGNNQEGLYNINAFTAQALISKKFSVITLYSGLGFNNVKTDFDLTGEYDLDDNGTIDLIDPITLDVKNSGFRATFGFRLKLGVFTLYGDYTFSEYNIASAGIGFSFREAGSLRDTTGKGN